MKKLIGQIEDLAEDLKLKLDQFAFIQKIAQKQEVKLEIQNERKQIQNFILNLSLIDDIALEVFLDKTIEKITAMKTMRLVHGAGIYVRDQEEHFILKYHRNINPDLLEVCNKLQDGFFKSDQVITKKKSKYTPRLEIKELENRPELNSLGYYIIPIFFQQKVQGALIVFLPDNHKKRGSEMLFFESVTAIIANTMNSIIAWKTIEEKNIILEKTELELRENLEELAKTQDSLKDKHRKLEAALAENLAVYSSLDKSMIISITDLQGYIIDANDVFCKTAGYTHTELMGQNQSIVHSGYHPREFWRNFWETINAGKIWSAEVKNKSKNGTYYWVDLVVNTIYDEVGNPSKYIAFGHLITDKKEAQEKIISINRDLQSSIDYARKIQDRIMVDPKKIQEKIPESFIFFRPRDVVSGDFYFYSELKRKIVIAAIDCTGHGIPGAFMSLISYNLLYDVVNNYRISEPNVVLNIVKRRIEKVLLKKDKKIYGGMDIALCTVDTYGKALEPYFGKPKLYFAGAKNPLVYFIKNQMYIIKGDNIVIGGVQEEDEKDSFTMHIIDLKKELSFYIFSDGIQDQFGGKKQKKFMIKRLHKLLHELETLPASKKEKKVKETVDKWQKNEEQTDDMIMIGMKMNI